MVLGRRKKMKKNYFTKNKNEKKTFHLSIVA